jgi:hypothetical protein
MKPPDPKEEPPKDAAAEDPADVSGRIERALAPYKDLVPPEDLQFMREMLELYANSHPDVATLIDGLRKRRQVARSTNMTGPGLGTSETADTAQRAAGSKAKARKTAKPGKR